MNRKRIWLVSLAMICFASSVALAQQKVPPPPKPPDDGPGLEETLRFIQEKLNGVGPISFIVYMHDNLHGNDWTLQFRTEVTKVQVHADSCILNYHVNQVMNGTTILDNDTAFPLKRLEKVVIRPYEQYRQEADSSVGHPEWSSHVEPPLFDLHLIAAGPYKPSTDFFFL
jgi:hypothetical protein